MCWKWATLIFFCKNILEGKQIGKTDLCFTLVGAKNFQKSMKINVNKIQFISYWMSLILAFLTWRNFFNGINENERNSWSFLRHNDQTGCCYRACIFQWLAATGTWKYIEFISVRSCQSSFMQNFTRLIEQSFSYLLRK